MARWIHIGNIPVDSARVIITDPSYLDFWNDITKEEEEEKMKKIDKRVSEAIEKNGHPGNAIFDVEDKSFSTDGAGNATIPINHLMELVNPTKSGILESDKKINSFDIPNLAAVCSTGMGDGVYPVYIKFDETSGTVTSMKIVFMEDEDDMQDEIVSKEDIDKEEIRNPGPFRDKPDNDFMNDSN